MNDLQLELTRLIGKKELTPWCEIIVHDENFIMHDNNRHATVQHITEQWDLFLMYFVSCVSWFDKHMSQVPLNGYIHHDDKETFGSIEILNHPATLSDFHRWMNEEGILWSQVTNIRILKGKQKDDIVIPYDSSKCLLDQEPSTLEQIISLIKSTLCLPE